jgi:hypothetical protein
MAESPPPTRTRPRGGALQSLLGALLPADNPAGVITGLLIIGALLAAESALHEKYIDTVGSTLIVVALYWLAHAYATVVGSRIATGERLSTAALRRALVHDSALVRGAAVPIVVLLVCYVIGASQSTAVAAALWSTVACLVLFELLAGLRSSSTFRELVLGVGVGLTMGVGILALRIILH